MQSSLCAPNLPPDPGPVTPISPSWVQWMDAVKFITRHGDNKNGEQASALACFSILNDPIQGIGWQAFAACEACRARRSRGLTYRNHIFDEMLLIHRHACSRMTRAPHLARALLLAGP